MLWTIVLAQKKIRPPLPHQDQNSYSQPLLILTETFPAGENTNNIVLVTLLQGSGFKVLKQRKKICTPNFFSSQDAFLRLGSHVFWGPLGHFGFLPDSLLSQLSFFKRILDHSAGQIFRPNSSANVCKLCKQIFFSETSFRPKLLEL